MTEKTISDKGNDYTSSFSYIIKRKLGLLVSPRIIPYIGFGNAFDTYITGEVQEDMGIKGPMEGMSKWQNAKTMVKRYLARDLQGIKVSISFLGMTREVVTDTNGVFHCHFEHAAIESNCWNKATIQLAEKDSNSAGKSEATAEVLTISNVPQYGVISDIDDTILVSYATKKLMKLRLMLMNNAHTRMPFEGVSAFYHALQRGTGTNGYNPVFYVSNSEWNLYDLLYDFIRFNRIPKGPLFLREMKIRPFRFYNMKEVNKNHKKEILKLLFSTYPEMKFILIGDSGQRDPEVYSSIATKFPGRVLAIYIRDLGIEENNAMIKTISQRIHDDSKTEMILVKDTEAAAKHAVSMGFIAPDYLMPVIREKQKDQEEKEAS